MVLQKINDYLQHTLREDFTSPNPDVRKGAIYALGRLGSGPDVLLILRNIAAQDEDPEVRYTAKKALNYWEGVLTEESGRDQESVDVTWPNGSLHTRKLQEALASPRPGLQIAAVIEAVKLGDPAALAPVRELMSREQDPWVLSMAVKAVGSLGDRSEIPLLVEYLGHDNLRVVANAIEALEMLDDPEIEEHTQAFLTSEDNRVRANAIKAVHPTNPDRAFRHLETMGRNHRPWMRASAIFCLKVLDDPRCEVLLLEMLETEFAADLSRQLFEAVSARGTKAAVGVLGALAETAEGERGRLAQTAYDVLARRLQVPLDEARRLVEEHRSQSEEARGHQSGMYRLEDIEGDDDEPSPGEVARPRAPDRLGSALASREPTTGYGSPPNRELVMEEDPGSRQALAVALVLALVAGVYGVYRLVWDPPRIGGEPVRTRPRPTPTIPDEIR